VLFSTKNKSFSAREGLNNKELFHDEFDVDEQDLDDADNYSQRP
jgi:hypothetical protein